MFHMKTLWNPHDLAVTVQTSNTHTVIQGGAHRLLEPSLKANSPVKKEQKTIKNDHKCQNYNPNTLHNNNSCQNSSQTTLNTQIWISHELLSRVLRPGSTSIPGRHLNYPHFLSKLQISMLSQIYVFMWGNIYHHNISRSVLCRVLAFQRCVQILRKTQLGLLHASANSGFTENALNSKLLDELPWNKKRFHCLVLFLLLKYYWGLIMYKKAIL